MLVINWFILYETSVTEYKRKGKERGEKREGRVGRGTEAVKGNGIQSERGTWEGK